jgi:hypothetical protein
MSLALITPTTAHAPLTPSSRLLRSAGAVLVGLVSIFAITTAVDVLLHVTHVFPPMGQSMSDALFALAFAYRAAIGVAGSYLTARLAPGRPLFHALTLGGIGLILSTVGAIAMWDPQHTWYPLAVAASAVPCAWLGARMLAVRSRHEECRSCQCSRCTDFPA